MPEVAEVAHICAQFRRHVVGYKIEDCVMPQDPLLFPQLVKEEPKVSHTDELRELILNKTVESVGRHGKYLWLRLSLSDELPVIVLMHMGMTGMIKIKGQDSHMITMENGGDLKAQNEIIKGRTENENEDANGNVAVKKRRVVRKSKQRRSSEVLLVQDKEGGTLTGVPVAKDTELVLEDGSTRSVIVEDIFLVKAEEVDQGETDVEEVIVQEEMETVSEWPPKYTKFELKFCKDGHEKIETALCDPRRLGRVRILSDADCLTDNRLINRAPLNKLGPDYSKDPAKKKGLNEKFFFGDPDPSTHGRPRLEFKDFSELVLSKRKAIKAILLDQEDFAGVGNWVADEILYQARIHPNENLYKRIFDYDHEVMKRLYESVIYVMELAVRVEGDVKQFPDDWLMLHRWGKARKKVKAKTIAGHFIDYITIGGRTSSFVPELQKLLKVERKGITSEYF